ncbi:MAG: peptidoglycan DD-metalloendopeptidase family protein [Candidatus Thiodiazotropha sp. (ex Ctena orbiculata)]|uniref:Peptidoglycan DD-metalloendopeptidase family protein n=1 Tax=Candidatus Thiodiazotropha taylori TaxID=2792791 RepID=A0A944QU57_9GAMM|nr:peptidoglycan DD-metalloendopeptidase family protein [Candidatus Thiodiazotropha taylori]MBT2997533.1 peptidoglycan DD-metalloendopeptidase family protein [Candidatus Thiodiazotropha taylori]MBV2112055.1 peptidoglycan DD-metalloendopeptidase family protein [Candidatus Thiodiazotropha taylori]
MLLGSLGLMLLPGMLFYMTACSSRGSAPVYNRTPVPGSEERVATKPGGQGQKRVVKGERSRTYYLVQAGDTLFSIAWRHDLSYQLLAAWNGIKSPEYAIYPGQRLRLKPPVTRQGREVRYPLPAQQAPPRTKLTPSSKPPPAKPATMTAKTQTKPLKRVTAAKPEAVKKSVKLSWAWPTKGRVVQTFSKLDQHRKGIRIQGSIGQPIKAAEAGKVVYAGGGLVGYGNLVIIKHDQGFLSAYGYNRKLLVKEGDKLTKGDIVAHMGTANSGGQPMLHFEVRRQGKPINPLPLLPRR